MDTLKNANSLVVLKNPINFEELLKIFPRHFSDITGSMELAEDK